MRGSPWRQECTDFLERFRPNGTAAGMRFKKRANGAGRGCSKEANMLQKIRVPIWTLVLENAHNFDTGYFFTILG